MSFEARPIEQGTDAALTKPDWEGNAMTVASVELLIGMGVLLLLALIVAVRPEVPRRDTPE